MNNKPSFLFNHLYMSNTRVFSTFNSSQAANQPVQGVQNNTTKIQESRNKDRDPLKTKSEAVASIGRTQDYIDRAIKRLAVKMDLVFETCLAQDTDFPICDSPVWVFGRSYSIHYDLDELRRAVATCLWCTYRKNFLPIEDTGLTSDKGWGCMIRAGQMLIAKALILRHLGPNWHWESHTCTPAYLKIVSLFADIPSAPLSIHKISESGVSVGKSIGSWLGPNTVAQSLKRILAHGSSTSTNLDIEMVIAMDSTLVKSEVKRACLSSTSSQGVLTYAQPQQSNKSVPPYCSFATPRPDPKWKPLMLIIPLRLGLSDLNPSYVPAFRAAFEVKQNIGIIGGRPNHALYFIGYAEDEVLFLDPHTVQATVTVGSKVFETEKEADETYHIQKPGRMPFAAMDPSIAVCFYCATEEEFDSLCTKLIERFATTPLPLFEICERRPSDWTGQSNIDLSPLSSPSSSFTTIGLSCSNINKSKSMNSRRKTSTKSADSSPANSTSSGKRSDDEFEILG